MVDPNHPWAEVIERVIPQPGPSMVKFDVVSINNEDGTYEKNVIMTVATESTVMSAFIPIDNFRNLAGQIQTILQHLDATSISVASPMDIQGVLANARKIEPGPIRRL